MMMHLHAQAMKGRRSGKPVLMAALCSVPPQYNSGRLNCESDAAMPSLGPCGCWHQLQVSLLLHKHSAKSGHIRQASFTIMGKAI